MKRESKPSKPHPGGAKTIRTPEMAQLLSACVAKGLPYIMCCSVAGISRSAFFEWKSADPAFAEQLEQALARGALARLKVIEDGARQGDWRASAWLLEHCLPQHFARSRYELTGADGAPLTAGVQLYLPRKDNGAVVETSEPAEVHALAERSPDGNGN
jgi:hypothetical protein